MGRSLWPCVSGWLAVMTLMGWLFASCDNEETGVPASLPDGKYPLSMTAEINQPVTGLRCDFRAPRMRGRAARR